MATTASGQNRVLSSPRVTFFTRCSQKYRASWSIIQIMPRSKVE